VLIENRRHRRGRVGVALSDHVSPVSDPVHRSYLKVITDYGDDVLKVYADA
jgi:hypothetical protein